MLREYRDCASWTSWLCYVNLVWLYFVIIVIVAFSGYPVIIHSVRNVPSDICANKDSNQPADLCSLIRLFIDRMKNFISRPIQIVRSEYYNQNAEMHRLIWIFAGRKYIFDFWYIWRVVYKYLSNYYCPSLWCTSAWLSSFWLIIFTSVIFEYSIILSFGRVLSEVGIAGIKSRCLKVIKCIFSRIVITYRIVAAHVVSFFFLFLYSVRTTWLSDAQRWHNAVSTLEPSWKHAYIILTPLNPTFI